MKPKFLENLGLKLLALVFGAIIWLVVLNLDDYSTTKRITDIPVELVNTDSITDQSKLFNVTSGETVDIVVKGRRTVVDGLTADDFTAVADMSQLSITNAVNVSVTANDASLTSGVSITIVDSVLQVELEDELTSAIQVTVVTKGTPADGYTTGTAVVTPNLLNVTGAASVVNKIDRIEVEVNIDGATSDVEKNATYTFYDAYGDEISSSKFTCEYDSVAVTVPIYATKEVKVGLSIIGEPADNYEITNVEYSPETVVIGATDDVLRSIKNITIDDIDVTGLTGSLETTVEVSKYLPEGAVTANDNVTISVQVTIERKISRSITITADDITIANAVDDVLYDITFAGSSTVVVSGLSDDVAGLTAASLGITIDASALTNGTNEVELVIEDGDGYTVESTCTATVTATPMP